MNVTIPEVFVLGGAAYMVFIGVKYALRIRASRSWPSIKGKIICSEIDGGWERDDGKGFGFSYMYKPVIRYEYFVDGQRCEGDEVSYAGFSSSIPSSITDPHIKFPLGSEVEVFYNPHNPDDSLLATARPPTIVFFLPFLISTALLVLVFTGLIKKWFS